MLYNTKNPHGGDIYAGDIRLDFSANTNPLGTPEGVKAAVLSCLPELHRYPDPYCRELVSAIAAHEGVPESYVLCGAGAAELIYAYCASAAPGKALMPAPTFAEYALALADTGCAVVRCPLREEDGFLVTETLIDALLRQRPDVLFLCDPNNPTGRLVPPGLKQRIVNVCASLGVRILADECFMDLAEGGLSLVPMLAEQPHVTVLKAFTKNFGMAGLRLGYCLSSDAGLLSAMSRRTQPWNVSTVAQQAGVAALQESGFIREARTLIRAQRAKLLTSLRALGLTAWDSDANFILFRADACLGDTLKERSILIRDCSNFPGLGPGYFRVAVKLPEENERLIEAIKECL